jgi:hypothetical protein
LPIQLESVIFLVIIFYWRGLRSKKYKTALGGDMRGFIAALCMAIVLSGCAAAPDRQRNALIGAGVGAGVGALIGSAAGGPPGGWAGAAIGAATGGFVGYLIRPEGCYFHNSRGETWQVPCEEARTRAAACFYARGPDGLEQVECPYLKRRRGA